MSATPASELAAAAALAFAKPFGGLIRLEADAAPPLWIDGRQSPPAITEASPVDAGGPRSASGGQRKIRSCASVRASAFSAAPMCQGDFQLQAI